MRDRAVIAMAGVALVLAALLACLMRDMAVLASLWGQAQRDLDTAQRMLAYVARQAPDPATEAETER